jgi:hypothetical protein
MTVLLLTLTSNEDCARRPSLTRVLPRFCCGGCRGRAAKRSGDVDLDGLPRAELERLYKGLTTLCLMGESEFRAVVDAVLAGPLPS